VPISIDPQELAGSHLRTRAIHQALGVENHSCPKNSPQSISRTACVVALRDIQPGERLTAK